MKNFRSEYAFQKYKPHISWRKRILRFFRKKQYTIQIPNDTFHYKANPYKIRPKPKKIRLKVIALFILLAAWVACLAYIPYFKINKIDYFGLRNTTKNELEEFIYKNYLNKKSLLPLDNYFFIKTTKISDNLFKAFALESVTVTKIFPNQLKITIKEKISSVIYDNGKNYWLLDSGGTAIKFLKEVEAHEIIIKNTSSSLAFPTNSTTTASLTTTTNETSVEHVPDYKKINQLFGYYPIIYDRSGIAVELKQENILPDDYIAAVIFWHKSLTEQGIAQPKYFIMDNLNSGIAVDTNEAWDILFQPKNNNQVQLNILKESLPTIKPHQYIDLRFGEKVYWK